MPIDRTLDVLCIFIGTPTGPHDWGGGMYYVQTGSNPPMPNLINTNGNIDMSLAGPFDPQKFTQNIDVTFTLKGYCPDGDQLLPVTWAPVINNIVGESAMIVRAANGTDPINEITARWVDAAKTQILIDDDNNDTNDYYYAPAVVIPSRNNYYISCDPQITNKGVS